MTDQKMNNRQLDLVLAHMASLMDELTELDDHKMITDRYNTIRREFHNLMAEYGNVIESSVQLNRRLDAYTTAFQKVDDILYEQL